MIPSTPLIVANWKMGVSVTDARPWVHQFVGSTTPAHRKHVIICPSFAAVSIVRSANRSLLLGAQNCSAFDEPAHTGSTSAIDLKMLGCQYVLIGHSERRRWLGETDAVVHAKMIQAAATGLIPILCIGEDQSQRKTGKTKAVLGQQLRRALLPIPSKLSSLIVAYEPVWAIGSSVPADAATITQTHRWIMTILGRMPLRTPLLLYGGAVDTSALKEICSLPHVDGVLVGRASWSAEKFSHLVSIL